MCLFCVVWVWCVSVVGVVYVCMWLCVVVSDVRVCLFVCVRMCVSVSCVWGGFDWLCVCYGVCMCV